MKRSLIWTLLLFAMGCGSSRRTPREPGPDEQVLRVLTYNVNYGLAGDEATLEAIRGAGADLVVLQETTPDWERALRAELSEAYGTMRFLHSRGAGGLAVLSRHPIRAAEPIESPSGWFPAWRLVVESEVGQVQVLAVHLRPPVSDSGSVVSGYLTTPPVREQEMTTFLETLDPGLPTIIAGDFNERDGRAVALIRELGYSSALPEFHGSQPTWRWQVGRGEIRSQLDHVATDERLVPLDARVLQTGRSDHLPVLVVLAARGR